MQISLSQGPRTVLRGADDLDLANCIYIYGSVPVKSRSPYLMRESTYTASLNTLRAVKRYILIMMNKSFIYSSLRLEFLN